MLISVDQWLIWLGYSPFSYGWRGPLSQLTNPGLTGLFGSKATAVATRLAGRESIFKNMSIEIHWTVLTIFFIAQIVWLWTLLAHLKSKDCDSTDKICWTIVLCVLNILGMILYFIGGPEGEEEEDEDDEALSEAELKRAFNEGRK